MERILRKLEKLENKVSHLSRQDVRSPALYRDESWEGHDDRRSLSPDTLSGKENFSFFRLSKSVELIHKMRHIPDVEHT